MKRAGDVIGAAVLAILGAFALAGFFDVAREYLRRGTFLEDIGALTVAVLLVVAVSAGFSRSKK